MSLNNTPSANRLHVALFGRRNSGKSSLINALTGQDTALVSDIPGTTTDTVSKAMEIQGIGPCLFIDTPGFDDEGELGEMRIIRTLKAIERTDIALLLCEDEAHEEEKKWMKQLEEKNIPVILLLNKADIRKDIASTLLRIEKDCGQKPLVISAKERTGIKNLKVKFNKVFGYYLEVTNSYKELVPEEWTRKQTLANAERYTMPKLKELEDMTPELPEDFEKWCGNKFSAPKIYYKRKGNYTDCICGECGKRYEIYTPRTPEYGTMYEEIPERGARTVCKECGATIKPHRVCKNCGTYKGKKVVGRIAADHLSGAAV